MKRVFSCAIVALAVLSASAAAQTDDAFWKRVLRWFGWSPSALANTRGGDDLVTEVYGELLRYDRDSGSITPVLAAQSVRSPVVTADGKRVFALSKDGIVEAPLTGKGAAQTHALTAKPERVVRLLAHNDARLLALTTRKCIVAIVPSEGKPVALEHDVQDGQRIKLFAAMRTCGDETLGEREEKRPPRRDLYIRRGGLSETFTRDRTQRFNADPIFEPGCRRVLFISRDRN